MRNRMNRFFSFLGSLVFSLLCLAMVAVPQHVAEAANACSFSCAVSLGAGSTNCNPQVENTGSGTTQHVLCAAQCRTACTAIGMAFDPSLTHASTCSSSAPGVQGTCSPCSCIPTTSLACTDVTSGVVRSSYCGGQCTTVCAAATARAQERIRPSASVACADGLQGTPQCVAISQEASVRLCRTCITACVSDMSRGSQQTPVTCYRACGTGEGTNPDYHGACQGVSQIEARLEEITPTAESGSGLMTPGTPGAPPYVSPPTSPSTEGTCHFSCQPQTPPTTCTTNEQCATTCQQVCGRSFQNGTCVNSGPGAARCGEPGAGGVRQCVFECSIGASAQERVCNPRGTGDNAPVRTCNSFCEGACRTASTQRVPADARFCRGTPPTCDVRAGSGTPSSGTAGPSAGSAPGQRLVNPIRGVDSIASLVGRLIKGVIGVVGSVALLFFVYGGIRWILSAGDPKEVTSAKNIFRNATIGMVLIFFSYTISSVILGLLSEIGDDPAAGGATTTGSQTGRLATCVEYAVTHGHIGRNEARDLTTASWACRQTQASERTDRSRCIARGCPNDGPTVLCCAPVAGSVEASGSAPAQTGGTAAPTDPTLRSAAVGCQITVGNEFHLRPTDSTVSSGPTIASGARVQVLGVGTSVRSGTRIHRVRVLSTPPQEGWIFLTTAQIDTCPRP